jgi:histidyl-tRNA synthetase
VQSTRLGAQSALCGGGRYDDLVKELGGPPTPSVGVGIGLERALIVLEEDGVLWEADRLAVFVVQATDDAANACMDLARELRAGGVSAMVDSEGKKMAAQLKLADRANALFAAIIGSDEIRKATVLFRELSTGEQTEVPRDEALAFVKGRI